VNLLGYGYPLPSASSNNDPAQLNQAIDGLVWYFPEVSNGWKSTVSNNPSEWYAIDFGQPETVNSVKLYFRDDGAQLKAPARYVIQCWDGESWGNVADLSAYPSNPIGDGENVETFKAVTTDKVRSVFTKKSAGDSTCLVEMKVY
jgi:hypothetical protein